MQLSVTLSIVGLIVEFVAGLILLKSIFITDEEIKLLAELPIEESRSHMSARNSGVQLNVAVIDSAKLSEYRDRYIQARKTERGRGRLGFGMLVVGFLLQLAGQILA